MKVEERGGEMSTGMLEGQSVRKLCEMAGIKHLCDTCELDGVGFFELEQIDAIVMRDSVMGRFETKLYYCPNRYARQQGEIYYYGHPVVRLADQRTLMLVSAEHRRGETRVRVRPLAVCMEYFMEMSELLELEPYLIGISFYQMMRLPGEDLKLGYWPLELFGKQNSPKKATDKVSWWQRLVKAFGL